MVQLTFKVVQYFLTHPVQLIYKVKILSKLILHCAQKILF